MTMNADQQRELCSLVTWLQTFENFPFSICKTNDGKDDPEQVNRLLSEIQVTRTISVIAEEICESPISHSDGNYDKIWTSLLILTSTRARPLARSQDSQDSKMSPARLKLYVLSNLLDCAVQNPNMRRRRAYIEQIMGLHKSVQKTLMSLIERRSGKPAASSSSKQRTPATPKSSSRGTSSSKSTPVHPPKTPSSRSHERRTIFDSPPRSRGGDSETRQPAPTTPPRPPSLLSSGKYSNGKKPPSALKDTSSPSTNSVTFSDTTEVLSNVVPTPSSSSARKNTRQVRSQSQNYASPSEYTPVAAKRSYPKSSGNRTPSQGRNGVVDFLSPGTLESPDQVQSIVRDLKGQNAEFHKILESYKQRDAELSVQIEELEANHRKHMIQLESQAMDREQDLQAKHASQVEELKKELQLSNERAEKGEQAVRDLAKAKDEMEMMKHNQSSVSELNEKLRLYKTKVDEMQDAKEALQREQEAHGRSVDEIVRLENELQTLQPLKRQLEDYKIRAIEAEVRLVECQDYLKRVEQEANEKSAVNKNLYEGTVMQKQQLEELQRRILEETQAELQNKSRGGGIGNGVSELNPELNEELHRLRNENLQLRAFAHKRDNDQVTKLEESLDDAKRLTARYKDEYLTTKKTLEETRVELSDTKTSVKDLLVQVEQWEEKTVNLEKQVADLEEQLKEHKYNWEQTEIALEQSEATVADQNKQLADFRTKLNESESSVVKLKSDIQQMTAELEETRASLTNSESTVKELSNTISMGERHVENMTIKQKELESHRDELQGRLDEMANELEDSRAHASSCEEALADLEGEQRELKMELEEERANKEIELQNAQSELESTTQMLKEQAKKELEELQSNMNQLLDDERNALKTHREEAKAKIQQVEDKWRKEYMELQERSTSTLKHSREESQDRMALLMEDHSKEMEEVEKKAQASIKEIDCRWANDYSELELKLKNSQEEYNQQLEDLKALHQREIEELAQEAETAKQAISQQADTARDKLITKGKGMLQDAKEKYKQEMLKLADEKTELSRKLDASVQQNEEVEKLLRAKISSQKNKLDFSASQVDTLTQEMDELQEKLRTTEREMVKLREDNDRCRRQLAGRFGAGGKVQAQLEKLQKEYNDLLEENRNYKKQARQGNGLGSIAENNMPDDGSLQSGAYGRGGLNKEALSQLREEYETMIENLNDEKRELVMKNSAATTDVKKAEQRAWEGEQEISSLKDQIVSLQLALQRAEFSNSHTNGLTSPPKELSFLSAREFDERSPPGSVSGKSQQGAHPRSPAPPTPPPRSSTRMKRSPSIERAMRDKADHENNLRSRLMSFTTSSPSKHGVGESPPTHILQSTRKHEEEANQDTGDKSMSCDVFGLGVNDDNEHPASCSPCHGTADADEEHNSVIEQKISSLSSSSSIGRGSAPPPLAPNYNSTNKPKTLVDVTQKNTSGGNMDSRPECQQS